ncbi:hypothetical protein ES332_A03G231300v1 [Gossypium tomentosum]|uniref:Tyrosinase copper-binding domain-containing protein n=1 Tax=Gossypium tomentosum TaxID=34277 RepID=A0A5D2RA93_GOSTO|nr:hypothetical protein ES332_A03G231300v1 [Gossypium tomentosum]
MAEKKWILILSLTFIIAVSQVHHLYMGELTSIMLEKLQQWRKPFNNGGKNLAIGPNLTACHSSYGRPDLLVYCCPPGFQNPVPFTDFKFPDPSPVRVRRPAHLLNESFIAKYNKALSIMKSLPYDDPRSFHRQANLHCQFCTGAYEMLNSSGSELNIHRTWMFFPWHRMMIYFHERILGSLIGDDTFALPFWAWDIPDGMTIPDFYVDKSSPFFHSQRDFSHFPPRVADLDYSPDDNDPRFDRKEQTETNLAFMYNRMVSGAKKTELFMGCTYKAGDKNCDSPGTIESAPHNTLHTWIGSGLNPGREDMGKFYSAAKDPVFYAHHSNIDRLWEVWRDINDRKLDIDDSDWLNSFFLFYDENLNLVKIKVKDVLDITKLGYSYEEVHRPWLNHRPPPSVPPEQARRITNLKQNENPVFSSDFRRVLDGKLTVTVNRSVKREKVDEEETVVVYGIVVRGNEYVKFDVYVNLSDDTKINPKFREFAGTFAYIPGGGRGGPNLKKMKLKLGISELLKDLKADEDESIWVTLVPRTTSCSNVSIEGIKIEYIK